MINHATLIGRSHRLRQQNCHDYAISGAPAPGCAFGLVLDGCGSKYHAGTAVYPSHNEVGAKLLGKFIASSLSHTLQTDPAIQPTLRERIPGARRTEALVTPPAEGEACLLYTSDAADERSSVDLGGRRIIKKKTEKCATWQRTDTKIIQAYTKEHTENNKYKMTM